MQDQIGYTPIAIKPLDQLNPPSSGSAATNTCGNAQDRLSPMSTQIGGDHYKSKTIQPVQYCMANGIGFMEGSVIKYVTRWRDKGGIQDLKKAKHFLELLIEYEETPR